MFYCLVFFFCCCLFFFCFSIYLKILITPQECTGSICLAYGMESCQCAPNRDGGVDDTRMCQICCKESKPNSPCISSFQLEKLPDLMAKPGMPCNDYNGYCDMFHRCREVSQVNFLAVNDLDKGSEKIMCLNFPFLHNL